MRILTNTPDSVLWLLRDNKLAERNLRIHASRAGVDPTRIVFAERTSHEKHLARHVAADLFLDTTPYNAHTTASDALRMGLPLLTLIGRSFPARVSASLLVALGLSELITYSEREYETRAVELAKNRSYLGRIRAHLQTRLPTAPLFDPKIFACHLERAFIEMLQKHEAHEGRSDIRVIN